MYSLGPVLEIPWSGRNPQTDASRWDEKCYGSERDEFEWRTKPHVERP